MGSADLRAILERAYPYVEQAYVLHGSNEAFTLAKAIDAALSAPAPDREGVDTYSTLREANVARRAAWCPEQLPDLSFRGNELAGETGEVCNVIKKLERERLGWRGSRDTVEHLAEELADVFVICADLVAISAGIDLDVAVAAKFNATSDKVGLPHKLAALRRPAEASTQWWQVPEELQRAADAYRTAEANLDPMRGTGFVARYDAGRNLISAALKAAPLPPSPAQPQEPDKTAPLTSKCEPQVQSDKGEKEHG